MTIGDTVTSLEAPGAIGLVSRRIDNDLEVLLLVSWITPSGQTTVTWHREHDLKICARNVRSDIQSGASPNTNAIHNARPQT